jgi:outer membrane usher protein
VGTAATPIPSVTGRKRPTTVIDIPIVLDGRSLGDVSAVLTSSGELLALDGEPLARLLQDRLLPERLAELRGKIDAKGLLSVADILASGLGLSFDPATVEARVEIPFALRSLTTLRLARPSRREAVEVTGPAPVSGYLNLLAGRDRFSSGFGAAGWQPLVVDLDGAMRAFDTVLEGVLTYRQDGAPSWARGDMRLVRDWPERRVRAALGDIAYGTDGFQSALPMGGVVVARNFDLQRYRSSAPGGETSLTLERSSRVEVFVNGQTYRILQLGPGRYDIRDFPFTLGTNDVTLRITDEVGRVEVIRFPFVFDPTLLGAGEHDFSYAVGFASQITASGRSYRSNEPAFSGYHMVGITDQLTVGANVQGSKDELTLGGEARWATTLGTLRADLAASRADVAGTGYAARLQYRYSESPALGAKGRSLAGILTYRSPSFATLANVLLPTNPIKLELGMRYGQLLPLNVYGSVGITRQLGRAGQADTLVADLNLSKRLGKGLVGYLLLSRRHPGGTLGENRVFVSLSWFPGGFGHNLAVSHDTASDRSRVEWHYMPGRRVDAVQADVSADRTADQDSLHGQFRYWGYRFTAVLTEDAFASRRYDTGWDERTSLQFGTALAYADGQFALSRPITDGFLIVARNPALGRTTVEVNTVNDIPQARTGLLGPAVLPEMPSYYPERVTIEAPDAPLGVDLGRQLYYVEPAYRSGTLVVAGTGATVIAQGTVVDASGQPMPLEPCTATLLDAPGAAPIECFTNHAGRFRVPGLRPGGVRLVMTNYPEQPFTLVIPAGSVGLVEVGRLVVRAAVQP